MRRKKAHSFALRPAQITRLESLSRQYNLSLSEMARDALDAYMRGLEKTPPPPGTYSDDDEGEVAA